MTDVLPVPTCAFLVIISPDGSANATNDLEAEVSCVRQATLSDIRRGCMEVVADIAAAQAADTVMERLNKPKPTQADKVRAQLKAREISHDEH